MAEVTPYYQDDWLTVLQGDCRTVLAELPDESVHCVVTSPPYWGLRDYGTATWLGGDPACEHRSPTMREGRNEARPTLGGGIMATNAEQLRLAARSNCGKCGAYRVDNQLGLEPTPEHYVEDLVLVFRQVRRVLRPDGTLWLNLGDRYAGSGKGAWSDDAIREANRGRVKETYVPTRAELPTAGVVPVGLKPKDLVGIPWRVAFALQADGWYLRSDIIWAKPNPMPESVTDRPTKSHEYLFLLSKSARYYYDSDAVREPLTESSIERLSQPSFDQQTGGPKDYGPESNRSARKALENLRARNVGGRVDGFTRMPGGEAEWAESGRSGRNLRSVWTVATQPYRGAHFATFPRKLIEPCIKAGTSERGVCPECGAPWVRETSNGVLAGRDPEAAAWIEKTGVSLEDLRRLGKSGAMRFDEYRMHGETRLVGGAFDPVLAQRLYGLLHGWLGRCVAEACGTETTGWRPSCKHGTPKDYEDTAEVERAWKARNDPIPATVLDPFAGSGTTGMVAQALSRKAVLIDLNADYLVQALRRNRDIPLGLVV